MPRRPVRGKGSRASARALRFSAAPALVSETTAGSSHMITSGWLVTCSSELSPMVLSRPDSTSVMRVASGKMRTRAITDRRPASSPWSDALAADSRRRGTLTMPTAPKNSSAGPVSHGCPPRHHDPTDLWESDPTRRHRTKPACMACRRRRRWSRRPPPYALSPVVMRRRVALLSPRIRQTRSLTWLAGVARLKDYDARERAVATLPLR